MKKGIGLLLAGLACLAGMLPSAHAQGGGCPATLPAVAHQPDVILESVLLAPANPEQASTSIPRAFQQGSAVINRQPGTQVFISSSGDALSGVCVDDVLEIRSASTGQAVRVDFRSADRERIVHLDPIGLPGDMFVPGSTAIEIALIDVAPGFYSNSNLYVLVVSSGQPPTVAPTAPAPRPTALPVPTLTPAPTSTPVATRTPVPTPSSTPTLRATAEARPTPSPEVPARPLGGWAWLAPLGLLPLLAFMLARSRNGLKLEGSLDIYQAGSLLKEVDLAPFGGAATLGSEGDIPLPGDDIPPIVARLRAQRADRGGVETVFETLDPETGQVLDSRPWQDGDEEVIGTYRIKYTNYNQADQMFDEGEFDAYQTN